MWFPTANFIAFNYLIQFGAEVLSCFLCQHLFAYEYYHVFYHMFRIVNVWNQYQLFDHTRGIRTFRRLDVHTLESYCT